MSKQGYMHDHTLLSRGKEMWHGHPAHDSCLGRILAINVDPSKIFNIASTLAIHGQDAHATFQGFFLSLLLRRSWVVKVIFLCILFLSPATAQDKKENAEEEKTERKADFSVAVKGDEQTLSSEFTAKVGKWQVGENPKCFQITAEPLVEGRIEFGPEYRETGVTIQIEAWAKSGNRTHPRFGVGLFGKNGFFLRIFPAQKRIELVRRGVVLAKTPFTWNSGEHYLFELSVKEDDEDWKVSGRVWPKEGKRPEKAPLNHKAWADELLFPLAGRSSAVATAFSGKAISFNKVEIFKKEEEPAPDAEGVKKDDSG